MLLDDTVHDGQSQARAAGDGVGERREETVLLLAPHSPALVGDRHAPGAVRDASLEDERPALRHGRHGVPEEVPEDLPQLPRVGPEKDGLRLEVEGDAVPVGHLVAVRQERYDVAQRGGGVDRLDRLLAGADVLEEVLEDRREAVRLLDDDLHQAPLRGAGRGGGGEDLDRTGDRGERVPDLVRDRGCQLADRGELLLEPHLTLELLQLGQVLEDQDPARDPAVPVAQRCHRDPEVDAGAEGRLVPLEAEDVAAGAVLGPGGLVRDEPGLDEGPPDELLRPPPQELAGRRVGEGDLSFRVRGDDAGGHRGKDRRVEGLQARHLLPPALGEEPGVPQLFRGGRHEESRRREGADVRHDVACELSPRPDARWQLVGARRREGPRVHQLEEHRIEDRGEPGRHEPAPFSEEKRAGDDDGEVEEGEPGVGAAGNPDEAGHDDEVAEDLDHGVHPGVEPPERGEGQERGRVGGGREVVDRVERKPDAEGQLDQEGGEEEGRDDDHPHAEEAPEGLRGRTRDGAHDLAHAEAIVAGGSGSNARRAPRRAPVGFGGGWWRVCGLQPIFEMRSNIGMYIATTMVPMMVPSMAIMIGSISFIRPSTALSTSSS